MRQCPAVAWEGWITKTHRRNEPTRVAEVFSAAPPRDLSWDGCADLCRRARSARIAFCRP